MQSAEGTRSHASVCTTAVGVCQRQQSHHTGQSQCRAGISSAAVQVLAGWHTRPQPSWRQHDQHDCCHSLELQATNSRQQCAQSTCKEGS